MADIARNSRGSGGMSSPKSTLAPHPTPKEDGRDSGTVKPAKEGKGTPSSFVNINDTQYTFIGTDSSLGAPMSEEGRPSRVTFQSPGAGIPGGPDSNPPPLPTWEDMDSSPANIRSSAAGAGAGDAAIGSAPRVKAESPRIMPKPAPDTRVTAAFLLNAAKMETKYYDLEDEVAEKTVKIHSLEKLLNQLRTELKRTQERCERESAARVAAEADATEARAQAPGDPPAAQSMPMFKPNGVTKTSPQKFLKTLPSMADPPPTVLTPPIKALGMNKSLSRGQTPTKLAPMVAPPQPAGVTAGGRVIKRVSRTPEPLPGGDPAQPPPPPRSASALGYSALPTSPQKKQAGSAARKPAAVEAASSDDSDEEEEVEEGRKLPERKIVMKSTACQVAPTVWTRYYFPRLEGASLDKKSSAFYSYFDVLLGPRDLEVPPILTSDHLVGRGLEQPADLMEQFAQLYYLDGPEGTAPPSEGAERRRVPLQNGQEAGSGRVMEDLRALSGLPLAEFCQLVSLVKPRSAEDYEPVMRLLGGALRRMLWEYGRAAQEVGRVYQQELDSKDRQLEAFQREAATLRHRIEMELRVEEEKKRRLSAVASKFQKALENRPTAEAGVQVDDTSAELTTFRSLCERLKMQNMAANAKVASLEKSVKSLSDELALNNVASEERSLRMAAQGQELDQELTKLKTKFAQMAQATALKESRMAMLQASVLGGKAGSNKANKAAKLMQAVTAMDPSKGPTQSIDNVICQLEVMQKDDSQRREDLVAKQLAGELQRLEPGRDDARIKEIQKELHDLGNSISNTRSTLAVQLSKEMQALHPVRDAERVKEIKLQLRSIKAEAEGAKNAARAQQVAAKLAQELTTLDREKDKDRVEEILKKLDNLNGGNVNASAVAACQLAKKLAGLSTTAVSERRALQRQLGQVKERTDGDERAATLAMELQGMNWAGMNSKRIQRMQTEVDGLLATDACKESPQLADLKSAISRVLGASSTAKAKRGSTLFQLGMEPKGRSSKSLADALPMISDEEIRETLVRVATEGRPDSSMRAVAGVTAQLAGIPDTIGQAEQVQSLVDQLQELSLSKTAEGRLGRLSVELGKLDEDKDAERIAEIMGEMAVEQGAQGGKEYIQEITMLANKMASGGSSAKEMREMQARIETVKDLGQGVEKGNASAFSMAEFGLGGDDQWRELLSNMREDERGVAIEKLDGLSAAQRGQLLNQLKGMTAAQRRAFLLPPKSVRQDLENIEKWEEDELSAAHSQATRPRKSDELRLRVGVAPLTELPQELTALLHTQHGWWRWLRTPENFADLAAAALHFMGGSYHCQMAMWELDYDPDEDIDGDRIDDPDTYDDNIFRPRYLEEPLDGQALKAIVPRSHMLAPHLYSAANSGEMVPCSVFASGKRLLGAVLPVVLPGRPLEGAKGHRDKCYGCIGMFMQADDALARTAYKHRMPPKALKDKLWREVQYIQQGLGRTLAKMERDEEERLRREREELLARQAERKNQAKDSKSAALQQKLAELGKIKDSLDRMMGSSMMLKALSELRRYKKTTHGVVCISSAVITILDGQDNMDFLTNNKVPTSDNGLQTAWKGVAKSMDADITQRMKDFDWKVLEAQLREAVEDDPAKKGEAPNGTGLLGERVTGATELMHETTLEAVNRSSKCAGLLYEWVQVNLTLWQVMLELREEERRELTR